MDIFSDPVILQSLQCPLCKGDVTYSYKHLVCNKCDAKFDIDNDIPLLYSDESINSHITMKIKEFYENIPFPNYNDFDSIASLVYNSNNKLFLKKLDEELPFNAKILEAGCGTGQLSNFLSISRRRVFGVDISLNSLKLARKFANDFGLSNVHFVQMNLMKLAFKSEIFDFIISNGVLHHTADPYAGFNNLVSLLKPKGFIMIGLYHKFGRLFHDIKKLIFNLFPGKFYFIDEFLNDKSLSETKRKAWYQDQYLNPKESRFTVFEIIKWFKSCKIDFVRCIPSLNLFEIFTHKDSIFKSQSLVKKPESFISELLMLGTNYREGGFFVVIGRKK